MFELIKAELSYNKKYLITGLILCTIFLLAFVMSGRIEREEIRYTTFSIAFWMFFFARWGYFIFNKDNLERVHASLPMPLNKIAMARVIAGIILWLLFLSIVVIVFALTSHLTTKMVKSIFFLNGLALTVNSFVFVWHDFIFIKPNKLKKRLSYAFYYIFTFTIIIVVYLTTSSTFDDLIATQNTVRSFFFTYPWILGVNSIAIILIFLNYMMYPIRSSYLHSEFGLRSNIKVKTGDVT